MGLLGGKSVVRSSEAAPTLPHNHDDIKGQVHELELSVESLRRAVKQMDKDLTDAIDGFYRRRQSDKMRAIREEEEEKKPKIKTWKDLLSSPVLKGENKSEE